MSQERIELRGSCAVELRCVDRVLMELARPIMDEDSIGPLTREALLQLGICDGGDASRKDLIVRLWERKRTLLRRMGGLDDSWPLPPVA